MLSRIRSHTNYTLTHSGHPYGNGGGLIIDASIDWPIKVLFICKKFDRNLYSIELQQQIIKQDQKGE